MLPYSDHTMPAAALRMYFCQQEAGGVYHNHVASEAQQSRARRWGCAWCGHRPRRWQLINLACFFLAATACVYVARSQSWRPLDVHVGKAGMCAYLEASDQRSLYCILVSCYVLKLFCVSESTLAIASHACTCRRRARKLELLVLGRNTDASGLSDQPQRESQPHHSGEVF